MKETLSGTIERVTFHNPENGFVVLRVQPRGKSSFVTVVGQLATAVAGEFIEAAGSWQQDPDHGLQFKADEMRSTPPHTLEGIEKYLGSGLIKGIGPHYARKIVQVFGERTLQVIDESPAFLKEIKGIGWQRIQRIRESWHEQKAIRDIMVFLRSHGVGTAQAVRIYKTYGDKAIELVQENPYRLADDIWGIGFQTADELARRLGVPAASPLRARAAVCHTLQQLGQDGHCGFPQSGVVEHAARLTGSEREIVADAVEYLVTEKQIVRDDTANQAEPWLYLPARFHAELGVARSLRMLQDQMHPLPGVDLEAALAWVERKINLELAPSQREAIRQSASSKVLVITGGPGVGKTTIVRAILEIFSAKGLTCGLTAPTGRAAKRLAETTGREAKTIHRLLEMGPAARCGRDRDNPLDLELLVVDEMSMVDVVLMHQLLRAVPPNACLILVGDVDQLPSVGPGMVLADIIGSGVVPVVRLTEIFRQAQESGIVRAAHRVLQGAMPEPATAEKPSDFYVIQAESPAAILDRIITLIQDRIPARFGLDPFRDIQVLTPMNRSELGVRNLNARLQAILNPAQSDLEVARFGWSFRPGDKVLQLKNNYDKLVFNGDVGRVTRIDIEDQELAVDFDGRIVPYDFNDLDELSLAYAMTIHKSQGSEYPAVVIPLHTQHYMFLQRNLLYTGITRGKKLVVIVGSNQALSLAVKRQNTAERCTALAQRLRDARRSESLMP
jgi:exodeoxyribonuclease V alpha subunit